MIKRTHLLIALGAALLFLPHISYKLIFLPVVLIAALLPDLDSPHSFLGSFKILRPMQIVVKHRGIFHSLTLCFLVSLAFAFVAPILAFPFFLGYSSHLFADSFTQEGIRPFWPLKSSAQGMLRTGSHAETIVMYVFLVLDVILFARLFI